MKSQKRRSIPLPPKSTLTINQNQTSTPKKEQQKQQDLGIKKWKIGTVPIGSGSQGQVFKALNIYTGIVAAVKRIIHLKLIDQNGQQLQLQQSITQLKILSKIRHPNVVQYIQDYRLQKQTLIFMQLVPSTLTKFYKSFGSPLYDNFINFARQIIQGLNYLHSQKIVHKDLKCSNILLDSQCNIKLSDYGCSKKFDRTMSLINYQEKGLGTFRGTAFWMAPEAIRQNKFTRKTDIWSLGCTLLELATAKKPWHQKDFKNQLQAFYYIGSGQYIPEIPGNLDENVKKIILCCLNLDPQKRLTSQQILKLPLLNQN